jgi:hypothetical protein
MFKTAHCASTETALIRQGRSAVVANDTMMGLLAADRPHSAYADKLMLFGQFVGSWDLDMLAYPSDGDPRPFIGEWHFGWVLEGRAIQDVLIAKPAAPDQDTPAGLQGGMGSTLRVYDPRMDAWWVVWAGPVDGEFSTLFARPDGDRIVLEGQWSIGIGTEDKRFRWSFSNITSDRFEWQAHLSSDGGQSWRLVEQMYARRRASPHDQ